MIRFKKFLRHGMVYRGKPWCVVERGDFPAEEKGHRFKTQDEADTYIEEQGGEPQPEIQEPKEPYTPRRALDDALGGQFLRNRKQTKVTRDCYCYEPEVKESGKPCLACQKRMDEAGLLREGKTHAEWMKTHHQHRGRILFCDLCGRVCSHPIHDQHPEGDSE